MRGRARLQRVIFPGRRTEPRRVLPAVPLAALAVLTLAAEPPPPSRASPKTPASALSPAGDRPARNGSAKAARSPSDSSSRRASPGPARAEDRDPGTPLALLRQRCGACHESKARGGLRLDSVAAIRSGGDSGPVIDAAKPEASELLTRIRSDDPALRMPPDGPKLPESEVRVLEAWLRAGLPDRTEADQGGQRHPWSFAPVRRPEVPPETVPEDASSAARRVHRGAEIVERIRPSPHPVDRFLRRTLAEKGLPPSPEADRRTLVRRLHLTLTGLPPTPAELSAALAVTEPDWFERLADRLLASPRFGERMARFWLDAVRFAESDGFETNQPRPNAWHYRDYVIRAFNDDVPYDRFVQEQLVGDRLGADAATGFLVAGAWDRVKSPDPVLTARQRADELHDMVSVTGSTFLGLTVGCARCHSHKFDPISQRDYHAMVAVFAGVRHGDRALRGADEADRARQLAAAGTERNDLQRRLETLEPLAQPGSALPRRAAVHPRGNLERFEPVLASAIRFTIEATNSVEPCLDELEALTTDSAERNVARADAGARVRSSGDYTASPEIHRLEFLHDGRYGNGRSWISNTAGRGEVRIDFAAPARIDRVRWSRDREGKYQDRLATRYRVDLLTDGGWKTVASSADRAPPNAPIPADTSRFASERAELRDRIARLDAELDRLGKSPSAYAGLFEAPPPIRRFHRGEVTDPREEVPPGAIAGLGSATSLPQTADESARRRALADWIVDPAHPLTARVIVNRIWQIHFGTGLVDTPGDFGNNGTRPTHPELLDWLAAELVTPTWHSASDASADPGADRSEPSASAERRSARPVPWSLKRIHRLLVTSAAWRQASAGRADGMAIDAGGRLLWRFPPRRLEAEAIRDAILQVSGKLDLTMGGPGFDLFEPNTNYVKVYNPRRTFSPDTFRRAIYQSRPRMQPDDTFGPFDCPDGGQPTSRRPTSTTPIQALALLNSPFMTEQAEFLAERLRRESRAPNGPAPSSAEEPERIVQLGFRLAFGRDPDEAERTAGAALIRAHGVGPFARALLNANEFLFLR